MNHMTHTVPHAGSSARVPLRLLLLVVLALTLTAGLAPVASAGQTSADFDGDGYADLAVGIPGEDVDAVEDAGAVSILYGSDPGVTTAGDQFWHQDSPGVPDAAEAGDGLGASLVTGDFDRDGYADLAVGAPDEDIGGVTDAGAVIVLYGGPDGLTAAGSRIVHQGLPGIAGEAEEADAFGTALAAGDLGRSRADDLAIGVPGESVASAAKAGVVSVLYGGLDGLSGDGDAVVRQGTAGVAGSAERRDRFGTALAVADLGRSGRADVAVGAPGQDVAGARDAGAVAVLYGSAAGLSTARDQVWHQDSAGIGDLAEEWDGFGHALAAADLGRGPRADLAVGTPYDGAVDLGLVNVLYGGPDGLSADGDQILDRGQNPDDFFGYALAAADFGDGAKADLAVGVPGADVTGDPTDPHADTDDGLLVVFTGGPSGLAMPGEVWHQDVADVEGEAEQGDQFGSALGAANFGADVEADLVIGVPREAPDAAPAITNTGAVSVLYGTEEGLATGGDQLLYQDSDDVEDAAEENDFFGAGLAP